MKRLYIIMCMLLGCLGCFTAQADELTCTHFTLSPGGSAQVDVGLDTGSSYTAFLLDITVPAGIEVTAATTALATHTVGVARQHDSTFRVLGYANDNATFSGGDFVRLTIAASDRMTAGDYTLGISARLTPDTAVDVADVVVSGTASCTVSGYATTAAAPVITFADGKLSMSCTTAGATIRYTLDGSEPDDHSAVYTAHVTISHNLTVKAYAVAAGMYASATAAYTVTQYRAATPVISIDDHVCSITCDTEGAVLRYSTSGSDPATGLEYTAPFTLTANCTVKAVAIHPDYANSLVAEAVEDSYVAASPIITFNGNKMTMSCSMSGTSIYYTTDGTEPTSASAFYKSDVTLYENHTVKAISVREGYTNSPVAEATLDYYKVETPVISIENGEHCTMSCKTANSRIYYCIASNPNTPFDRANATLYENAIQLTDNCFVQAIAERERYNTSDMAVKGVYNYGNNITLSDITLTGEERGDINIALANKTAFAAIQFVVSLPSGLLLDGDTPVELGTDRKADHTLAWHQTQDGKVKVVIFSATNHNLRGTDGTLLTLHMVCDNAAASGQKAITVSDIVCATADGVDYFLEPASATFTQDGYTETVAAPVIKVSGDRVSMSTTTVGANIYYTLDGSYPNTATSARYTSMFILEGNATIRAIAACEGMNMSSMTETIVNTLRVAVPVLKMQGNDSFTLSTATRGAEIHYTLDGSEPTQQSALYTDMVTLTANCTVRAKAFRTGWLDSPELTRNIQSLGQYVYAEKAYLTIGSAESAQLTVRCLAHKQYAAYQMDVALPTGLVLDGAVTGCSANHTLAYSQLSEGVYRVLVYNTTGTLLPSGDIPLFTMSVKAADNAVAGDVEIGLRQIVFSCSDGSGVELGDASIDVVVSAQSLHMSATDYNILKAFYTVMDGSNWTDTWETSSDMIVEESWPGVTFDDGHVVAIDLQDQGLTGTLPAAIFSLPALRSLNLGSNHISGCVDDVLDGVHCTTIETLDLSGNELTGDVYAISQAMPQLSTLLLGRNRLSSVSQALPQELTQLDLSYQSISTDIRGTLQELKTDKRSHIPSIVTYNHAQKNFLGLNLTLTNTNPDWSATMKYGAEQSTCTFSGKVNEYTGEQGGEVQMRSLNTQSYGSTFVVNLDYVTGDATFDDMVNTQDLTTILNFMGGKYPAKNALFNRSAANVYSDSRINVQDIVLLVDMLLDQPAGSNHVKAVQEFQEAEEATGRIFFDGNELVLEADAPVAAMLLQIDGVKAADLFWCADDYGFSATARDNGGTARAVLYSMQQCELPAGRTTLAYLRGDASRARVRSVEATDSQAALMRIVPQDDETGIMPCVESDGQGQPYNLSGQRVDKNYKGIIIKNGVKYAGKH